MTHRLMARLITLALGLLAVSWAADAQLPMKVPRVGVLSPQHSTESPTVQREPLAQGLRALLHGIRHQAVNSDGGQQ